MDLSLASSTANYVLRKVSLEPTTIYSKIVPSARSDSALNNDLKGPGVVTPRNSAYQTYVNYWSVHSMSGVRIWLQIIRTIRDKGKCPLFLITSWDMFHVILRNAFSYVNLSELDIPIIRSYGNTSRIRSVTLTEYLKIYPRLTPFEFFEKIVEIVLFGFTVDEETISALRIENEIMPYILGRIRSGQYYPLISSLLQGTSNKRSGAPLPSHSSKRTRF